MAKTSFDVDRDKREIRMSRIFDAPPDRLQQAYTDPRQIEQWWGPRKYKTRVDRLEARIGGGWRYLNFTDEGEEYAFRGEFQEILPNRLTSTFEWEGMPGHISTDTALFDALPDGRTRLTSISRFANREDLDGMLSSDMETGARETWDRLAELVEARKEREAPQPGA